MFALENRFHFRFMIELGFRPNWSTFQIMTWKYYSYNRINVTLKRIFIIAARVKANFMHCSPHYKSKYILVSLVPHSKLASLNSRTISLKQQFRHFEEIFVTGCTGSCRFDNFQCSQGWKFHRNGKEDIAVSVMNTQSTVLTNTQMNW